MSLYFLNLTESKTGAIKFGSLAVSGNIQQVIWLYISSPLYKKWVLCLILL